MRAPAGRSLPLTVDGTVTALDPGATHAGALVLTVD